MSINKSREKVLASRDVEGSCVVYVMSRDQRVRDNHALLHAQQRALDAHVPLVVVFNLLPKAGARAREHYVFMLDGLQRVKKDLEALNIPFVIITGDPRDMVPAFCTSVDAMALYFDFNPMSAARAVQKSIAETVSCSVYVVDTHNIVPAWVASDKREYAAHTIRRKIHKQLEEYLVEPGEVVRHPYALSELPDSHSFADVDKRINDIAACGIRHDFDSGESAGRTQLKSFINDELASYAQKRNDIADDHQSQLSPYLHYGQLSSLRVALDVLYAVDERPLLFEQAKMAQAGDMPNVHEGLNALFEEMIVRKELSDNFCLYTDAPTSLKSADPWAQATLDEHTDDIREHMYTTAQLEKAITQDEAWNAAERQMTRTGKMHGYMRMYWAKKILEWGKTPQDAIDTAVYLNDHYSLDGGDPNGYVGIMWSIAGVHDRAWTERPIFGKIRYMNEGGLRRKFDVDAYIRQWSA